MGMTIRESANVGLGACGGAPAQDREIIAELQRMDGSIAELEAIYQALDSKLLFVSKQVPVDPNNYPVKVALGCEMLESLQTKRERINTVIDGIRARLELLEI
jgi:hypothetical protein